MSENRDSLLLDVVLLSLCFTVALLGVILHVAVNDLNYQLAIIFLSLDSIVGAGGLALATALGLVRLNRNLRRHRYPISGLWVLVMVFTALVVIRGKDVGEWIFFLANKASYEKVYDEVKAGACSTRDLVGTHPHIDFIQCGDPTVIVFPWTWFGVSWFGIIYDSDDEMVKPANDRWPARQTEDWVLTLSRSVVKQSLGHHYYLGGGWYN